MSYRKNYTVSVQKSPLSEETFYTNLGLKEAISTAEKESQENILVFISTLRKKDGQVMYYNRDGFNFVGKSWW